MVRVVCGRVVRYGALATKIPVTAHKSEPDPLPQERELLPSDFRRVEVPFVLLNPYEKTLGVHEREQLAACLVSVAQDQRRWVRIKREGFAVRLRDQIPGMVHDGLLDENAGGVMLTQRALRAIKARY